MDCFEKKLTLLKNKKEIIKLPLSDERVTDNIEVVVDNYENMEIKKIDLLTFEFFVNNNFKYDSFKIKVIYDQRDNKEECFLVEVIDDNSEKVKETFFSNKQNNNEDENNKKNVQNNETIIDNSKDYIDILSLSDRKIIIDSHQEFIKIKKININYEKSSKSIKNIIEEKEDHIIIKNNKSGFYRFFVEENDSVFDFLIKCCGFLEKKDKNIQKDKDIKEDENKNLDKQEDINILVSKNIGKDVESREDDNLEEKKNGNSLDNQKGNFDKKDVENGNVINKNVINKKNKKVVNKKNKNVINEKNENVISEKNKNVISENVIKGRCFLKFFDANNNLIIKRELKEFDNITVGKRSSSQNVPDIDLKDYFSKEENKEKCSRNQLRMRRNEYYVILYNIGNHRVFIESVNDDNAINPGESYNMKIGEKIIIGREIIMFIDEQ